MPQGQHMDSVLAESQRLQDRLLRLAAATAYTQEYAAGLLDATTAREASDRARRRADLCRDFAVRLVALSRPTPDADAAAIDADLRGLGALGFANAPVAMTVADVRAAGDPDGQRPRAVVINQAFARLLGYSLDELQSAADQSQYTDARDLQVDVEHVQALLTGRSPFERWHKRYVHADGHLVWAQVSASVVHNPDGVPRYVVAQVHEITEQAAQEIRTA